MSLVVLVSGRGSLYQVRKDISPGRRDMRAIGLMSGTSLDGVDAALIETDGEVIEAFGPSLYRPYSEAERAVLRAALAAGPAIADRDDRSGVLGEAEILINT